MAAVVLSGGGAGVVWSCRNYLCFGTQKLTEAKAAVIDDEADTPHKFFVKIPVFDSKKDSWTYYFTSNCCYYICHKAMFDGKDWDNECSIIRDD